MSFEYLADPSRPAWAGLLPGKPEAYFLAKEKASTRSSSPTPSRSC